MKLLEKLFTRADRLPLNRKERFYTATLLPSIICTDGLSRFFKLLNKPDIKGDMSPDSTNIQIFSEYDLRDAIRGDRLSSSQRQALLAPLTGDTPDVVILVDSLTPLLVVLEAKLFDDAIASDIAAQIARQRVNIQALLEVLPGCEALQVALVSELIVEGVRTAAGDRPDYLTITWEQIASEYANVPGAAYWVRLLKLALSREEELRAEQRQSWTYADRRMTVAAILNAYEQSNCPIRFVGVGGVTWELLRDDIVSSGGTKRKYAVSYSEVLPSRNYIGVIEFVRLAREWLCAPIAS